MEVPGASFGREAVVDSLEGNVSVNADPVPYQYHMMLFIIDREIKVPFAVCISCPVHFVHFDDRSAEYLLNEAYLYYSTY